MVRKLCTHISITALACALALAGCTADDSGDEQAQGAALLLALTSTGCTVGTVNFTASGVTCSGGSATGTGTLTASSPASNDLSVQLTFSLASGGTLEVLGGYNTAATAGVIARGFGVSFANSGGTAVGPSDTGALVAGMGAAASQSVVRCVDVHAGETPPHIIGKAGACPSGTESAGSQAIDDEARTGSASTNRGWGLVLSNATVTAITVNASRKFTE